MPRSACPHCGYALQAIDLIPILSWLCLRGRCRNCKVPISFLYPLIEAITALACVGLYWVYGLNASALLIMMTAPFLIALVVIDFEHYILPDSLNVILASLWFCVLIVKMLAGAISYSDAGWACVYGSSSAFIYAFIAWLTGQTMKLILKKEALGFGDVKFFAVAGLWLGVPYLSYFLMLAGICGIVIGLVYRLVFKNQYFPFGPALIVSYYCLLITKGLLTAEKSGVLYVPFPFLR